MPLPLPDDPVILVQWILLLALAGVAAGLIAGLLGVGGGIVSVPVLFYVFGAMGVDDGIRMHAAVGTSLAAIIPTAFMSARAHHRRGSIDPEILKSWGPAVVAGVVLGALIAAMVEGYVLSAVFATVVMVVGINMLIRKERTDMPLLRPGPVIRSGLGVGVGCLSALMGIGGGTFSVPILSGLGHEIRRAVGTSAAIGMIIAIPGALGFAVVGWGIEGRPIGSLGYVNLLALAALIPTTMLMAPVGARVAHAIPPRVLRAVFALFLLTVATRMFLEVI